MQTKPNHNNIIIIVSEYLPTLKNYRYERRETSLKKCRYSTIQAFHSIKRKGNTLYMAVLIGLMDLVEKFEIMRALWT